MSQLKAWQHHIRHTYEGGEKSVWCGATLSPFDWTFTGLDHAAYSALREERQKACPSCVRAARVALESNQ